MAGKLNTTVMAVRVARTLREAANIGKGVRRRRKIGEVAQPLSREERVRHYANQTGWTADFTPKQRRRLRRKANAALLRAELHKNTLKGLSA